MGSIEIQNAITDDDEMIGPVVITPGGDEHPEPIFWSKACRQLGIPSEAQEFEDDGVKAMKARLPVMPRQTYEAVLKRSRFLLERENQGLPTEQLPSGKWPDSLDEFADQVPVSIAQDEGSGSVYIDFGRPIQAIGVGPAMARTLATMLMTAADELDPDGELAMSRPELLNVARLRIPGQEAEQEGNVVLPGVLTGLKTAPEEGGIEAAWERFTVDKGVCVGLCEDCGQPQYASPGGDVCANGHGGAPSVMPCGACIHRDADVKRPSDSGRCGAGLFPENNGDNDCQSWEHDDGE